MKLTSTSVGWLLAMDEGLVQRIEIDFRLGLLLGDNAETASLYIETPCYLCCEGRNILLTPEEASSLAPILGVVNTEVAEVSIQRTGHLTVRLKDGRSLEVDPNEQYEAWQIGSTIGFLLVCAPGGEVGFFQQSGVKKQKEDHSSPY